MPRRTSSRSSSPLAGGPRWTEVAFYMIGAGIIGGIAAAVPGVVRVTPIGSFDLAFRGQRVDAAAIVGAVVAGVFAATFVLHRRSPARGNGQRRDRPRRCPPAPADGPAVAAGRSSRTRATRPRGRPPRAPRGRPAVGPPSPLALQPPALQRGLQHPRARVRGRVRRGDAGQPGHRSDARPRALRLLRHEHPAGNAGTRSAGDPAAAIQRQAAAGDDAVQVRMQIELLAPGVQDGKEPEASL